MHLDLDFVARALHVTLPEGTGNTNLTTVTMDSRQCRQGSLFLCLPGEHADGHDFAEKAVENGCAAILALRDPFSGHAPVPVLLVPDVGQALRRAAMAWRDAYAQKGGRVLGLTGTAGKTTVKEVLAHVMEQAGLVSRTMGNFNNGIGLPLSLLNADPEARCWIMEAGISEAGDMDDLGSVLRPDLAVILNAGPGHTAGLGKKGTAHHKSALLKYLQPHGTALVSADYPELAREARAVRQVITFFSSTGRQVDYRSAYVGLGADGKGLYRLWLNGESLDVETPFSGGFGAENVIAVAAAAHLLGLGVADIAAGLASAALPKQRFARLQAGGWTVIDDSYNANPLSASRMLEAAAEIAADGPLVCVLGEMRELGAIAKEEHHKLGCLVAEKKAKAVFWAGGHYGDVADGLAYARFNGHVQPVSVDDPAPLFDSLKTLGLCGGVILFKGSRANKLENLVAPFVEKARNHAV